MSSEKFRPFCLGLNVLRLKVPPFQWHTRANMDYRNETEAHDDVIKWKHFPRYWPFVRGIHRPPVNSPHKGQWRGALMFSSIYAWIKRLSKQLWGWWFETPSLSLWRHCNKMAAILQTAFWYIFACMKIVVVWFKFHWCFFYHLMRNQHWFMAWYRTGKISNIRRTESPNLNVSRLALQLSLCNILKPGVRARMKMQLEQRRQAMLQLHLSDQQFSYLLRCVIY